MGYFRPMYLREIAPDVAADVVAGDLFRRCDVGRFLRPKQFRADPSILRVHSGAVICAAPADLFSSVVGILGHYMYRKFIKHGPINSPKSTDVSAAIFRGRYFVISPTPMITYRLIPPIQHPETDPSP